jgi:xanthine dehydrogenase accessory factor
MVVIDQFLKKVDELLASEQSFAIAVVVRYEAPISGKPGNKAIILPDGKIWGWIGGGCAQPMVAKEALKSLADGQPRLIRISPSASPEDGIVDYTMTCHSGGTLDIYIEPVLPKPHVVILGRSPVAVALVKLAKAVNYTVSVAAPEADRASFPDADAVQTDLDLGVMKITPQTLIVVSTQGHQDEEAVEHALRSAASYVAFVASRTKTAKIIEYLKGRGLDPARLAQLRAPAGLNIHASTPEEIAVSILAEIIQVNRSAKETSNAQAALTLIGMQEAKDPVCGMTVEIDKAKHKSEFRGSTFYFCCAACKQKFDKQPEQYALAAVQL